MIDITCFGDAVIDFTPAGVSPLGLRLYERHPGGSTSNVAFGAAKLGAKSMVMTAVGEDLFGHFLSRIFKDNHIDTSAMIFTKEYSTFLAFVEIDEDGDRTFFSLPNAVETASLQAYSLDKADFGLLDKSRIFHTSGCTYCYETTRGVTNAAFRYMRDKGGLVSFDLNWRPFLFDKAFVENYITPEFKYVDILKISEEELEILTGIKDLAEGCKMLHSLGVSFIAVTLGPRGSYYSYIGGHEYQHTYDIEAVDTNGAGDTFMATLLYGIIKQNQKINNIPNCEMRRIVDFANAAAAVCVSKCGSMLSMPSISEIHDCQRYVKKKNCY